MSDPRIETHWKKLPLDQIEEKAIKNSIVILSYPDDEGVLLNQGRPGAAEGPTKILQYLGRMIFQDSVTPDIFILEKYQPESNQSSSLAERHSGAERAVLNLLQEGFRVITLGGGHDYGFPDASAYFQYGLGKILNIDAHLDLRPVVNQEFNSGTPFFRFVEKFGGKNLIEWGLQPQCNATAHMDYAVKNGMEIFDYQSPLPKIAGPVGLSICLDAFQGIRGVSAPAIVGLDPQQGVEAVKTYGPHSKWLGLYECAPAYDPLNHDSARLAALFAYHFIHSPLKI